MNVHVAFSFVRAVSSMQKYEFGQSKSISQVQESDTRPSTSIREVR